MMRQYIEVAEKNSDSILFFRVGDFYETFFEQAKLVSKELNLVLTSKECGIDEKAPMCGVPYHAVDVYLSKLVKKGYKVAIAEQLEDPKLVKGIVKRDVTKIITPGTVLDAAYLDDKINNFLLSICFEKGVFGISLLDFSTSTFLYGDIKDVESLYDQIIKYAPHEIIANKNFEKSGINIPVFKEKFDISLSILQDSYFDKSILKNTDNEFIRKILETSDEYIKNKDLVSISASLAAYIYVKENQKRELSHIRNITYINDNSYMYLDKETIRSLELTENMNTRDRSYSLLSVLDSTKTAIGARKLRLMLEEPLKKKDLILYRQNAVKEFSEDVVDLTEIREYLSAIYDLERILARIDMKTSNARDLIQFKNSIYVLPYIRSLISGKNSKLFQDLIDRFDTLKDLFSLIDISIIDDPPYLLTDGGIIKTGFNEEIDKLRESKVKGKEWLLELENKEKEKTGIKNLKIKYSRLTGYLFEISNVYKGEIPSYFIRKQTLSNAERYSTKELTELESLILSADDKLKVLEHETFNIIRDKVAVESERILNTAMDIGLIDVITNLAYIANKNKYACPEINENGIIDIIDGRHPVIETFKDLETFISNDTKLSNDDFINIITGPNMAGKSTYMRQVALICLMAHIGSFVPAKSANIALLDRIFTRVGASDDLSRGKSTFMVEMTEVSNIVKNATKDSLIILDEIGRGTSTYDGLSIAYAVIEYISEFIKAKTLFSTHYHELTELEGKVKGVNNFNVSVLEEGENIKFLRKIVRGSAKKSYGIAVAKLSGIPSYITDRASIHLENLIKR